jgi:chromosome segregation ATPase
MDTLGHVLTEAEVAALGQVKAQTQPQPAPAPEPEPIDDDRPLELLEADERAARGRLEAVQAQRLDLAGNLAALDGAIEAARESLDPAATTDLRSRRSAILGELDELRELEARANSVYTVASAASSRARLRLHAAEILAEIDSLNGKVPDAFEAIERAIGALLDAEDAFEKLAADIETARANLAGIPADLRGRVPNSDAGMTWQRMLTLRQGNRRHPWTFGL